jgi:hypothetical protein
MTDLKEFERRLDEAIMESGASNRDKYFAMLKIAQELDHSNIRADVSCLRCYHMPVCQILYRARRELREPENIIDYYKRQADLCDFYV